MTPKKFKQVKYQHKQILYMINAYTNIAQGIDLTKEGDYDDLKDSILAILLRKPE